MTHIASEMPPDRYTYWECPVCSYAWSGCADFYTCPRCDNDAVEVNPPFGEQDHE